MESAQYLYMDIHDMDNFFNWTMTYRFKIFFNCRKLKKFPR